MVATPALLQAPILPGIMRRVALNFARDHGCDVEERVVNRSELADATAVFLTNSVRGVRPVDTILMDGRRIDLPPGGADWSRLFVEELPRFIRSMPEPDEPAP